MTHPTMPELPAFPRPVSRELQALSPGKGRLVSRFSREQMDAYALTYGELVREACAKVAEQTHPQDWPFIGAAIRSMGSKP